MDLLFTEDEQQKHQQQQQPPLLNAATAAIQVPSKLPSNTNTVCDTTITSTTQQPRCIVETITMTTVTERQIVQHETRPVAAAAAVAGVVSASVHDGDGKRDDLKCTTAPDDGYVMIKCGNNTVLYNNRNPNSAVRQLFPATKFVCPPTRIKETDDARLLNKYLITEESLRAFDSRSLNGGGLLQVAGGGYRGDSGHCSDDDDDDTSNSLIRRTIERSTLRRNTAKKKTVNDTKEISLIEKIRRLTCDSDDDTDAATESAKKSVSTTVAQEQSAAYAVLLQCDSAQTSSAATTVPGYKKLTDLFGGGSGGGGRYEQPLLLTPDPATGKPTDALDLCDGHSSSRAATVRTTAVAGGKPFLSTLATACVTGNMQHPAPGGGSSTGATGSSIPPPSQCPQPDVVAGTQVPGSHCRQEELVAFVQQDSGRLEKIRKRYMPPAATTAATNANDEDDENDDYGFNRRPEVHGIRSGFSAQITIKNNHHHQQPPPQRPRSYYGDPARPPPLDVQPDFVPRYQAATVRARIQADPRAPPPYSAASQRSIIRVTHGQQQQTIRVPYQAVGPVQVHLLTTTAASTTNVQATAGHQPPPPPPPPPPSSSSSSTSQLQIRHPANEYIVQAHGHARIHHGQQFVIARGTQTAAISTTRYYQLPPLPPSNHQQQQPLQLTQPQLPPQAFHQLVDDVPTTTMTACTVGSRQQEFAVEHGLPSSSVTQTPKNPMLFYGMNV